MTEPLAMATIMCGVAPSGQPFARYHIRDREPVRLIIPVWEGLVDQDPRCLLPAISLCLTEPLLVAVIQHAFPPATRR